MEWWEDSEVVASAEPQFEEDTNQEWWKDSEPVSRDEMKVAVQSLDIRDRLEQSYVPNIKAGMMSLGASVVSPIQRVLGYDKAADRSNIIAQQYQEAAEGIARSKTDYPIVARSLRGVISTVPTQVIAAQAGGPYAGLALAAGQEANQAITEGRQAGLKGSGLAAYSLAQGAIEGTVGAVFQKIGLGGVEKLLGSKPAEQAVKQGIGNVLKEVANTAAQELPEELLTEIGHAVTSRLSGVDPNALSPESLKDLVANTAAQTILTVGIVESPRIVEGLIRKPQPPQQPRTPPEESAALDSRLTELAGQQQTEPVAEPWLEDAANETYDTVSENTPAENVVLKDKISEPDVVADDQIPADEQPPAEAATGELLPPDDDSVFIWKDGKRQRVTVSTVREDDGWKVKRIKLHSEDGTYEPVDFPDEAGRGYDSPEEAESDIRDFLQNKYPQPPGLPAPAKEPPPSTNDLVPATNPVVPPESAQVAQEPPPRRIGPADQAKSGLDGLLDRAALEQRGQELSDGLDELDEKGITPKQVTDEFFDRTYDQLPPELKQQINARLKKESGFEPGSVLGVHQDGSELLASDWKDIGKFVLEEYGSFEQIGQDGWDKPRKMLIGMMGNLNKQYAKQPQPTIVEPPKKRISPKVTPQVTEPPEGTKYVLPSFVTQPYVKPAEQQAEKAEPRRGKIGDMLGTSEVVLTASGRPTTPFPKLSTDTDRKAMNAVKAANQWLLLNALEEAKSRGDDFNFTQFSGEVGSKSIPQASKDAMEQYLFGDEQPAVPKPFLKDISQPGPSGSVIESPDLQLQRRRDEDSAARLNLISDGGFKAGDKVSQPSTGRNGVLESISPKLGTVSVRWEDGSVLSGTDVSHLSKSAQKPQREFSSTQVNLPADVAAKVEAAASKISDEDLAEKGREDEPHVTVKFGLHTNSSEDVRKLLENEPPIVAKLGKVSVFPDTGNGDVVKAEVESDDLHRLNKKITDSLPNTDTHPEYKPHVTLAYVKPGTGEKYAGMTDLEGTEIVLNKVAFSDKDRNHTEIELKGRRSIGKPAATTQVAKIPVKPDDILPGVEIIATNDPESRYTHWVKYDNRSVATFELKNGRAVNVDARVPSNFLSEKIKEAIAAFATTAPKSVEPKPSSSTVEQTPASRLAFLIAERLARPGAIDSDVFFTLADMEFGGTRAEGKYGDSEAYDALELAVNKYLLDRYSPAVNSDKAKEAVAKMEVMSDRVPRHKARTGEKDTLQQFSTPPAYAYVANWAANITPQDVVLEPSAGTGGLAVHAINAGAKVYANEIDADRRNLLATLPLAGTFKEDAEHIAAILPKKMPAPTVVVMNPPFSRAGHRMGDKMVVGTDRKHIDQALALLAPNGRLVAIVGAGLHGRGKGFSDWLSDLPYDVKADIEIGRDVYKGHGTTFPTRLLVIDKQPRSSEVVSGAVETLPEAIELLEGVRNERNAASQQQPTEPTGKKRIGPAQPEPRPDVPVQPPASGVDAGSGTADSTGLVEPVQQPVAPERTDDVPVAAGSSPAGASVPGTGKLRIGPRSSEPTGQPVAKPEPAGDGVGTGGQPVSKPSGKTAKPADSGRSVTTKPEEKPEPAEAASEDLRHDVVKSEVEKATRSKKKELGESTYEPYEPRVRIKGAKKHPASIVESAAMSAIDPPEVTYAPRIPAKVIAGYKAEDGTQVGISDLQLEAVATAGQAHEQILPNGDRRGFMIGDGTGVGKAREIAGIILDNWNQGRKKAVWISKNNALFEPAKEEWSRVGGDKSLVFSQNKIDSGKGIDAKQGILFTTYSTLGGDASDKAKQAGNAKSRLDQIVDWFGEDFDGVIVFDESHQMGSATSQGKGRNKKQASRQALAGVDLQAKLPKARVVYLSATSATEVSNLAYATRLGLWGEGTAFSDRSKFISEITDGGVAAMEKVAADMKAMGMYLARNIAFNDGTEKGTVTYERMEHTLTPDQHAAYDKMAEAWGVVFQKMNEAMQLTGAAASGKAKGDANGQFWAANQRFWNQVITAMQTPAVIKAIEKDLAEGRSAVIQLTNTNEAAQTRALANREINEDEEDDLSQVDISPKYILMDYIERSFPTTMYEDYIDDEGNERSRPVKDSEGNPVKSPEAEAMKAQLLDQLGSLKVANRGALDMVIDHFGEDMVAEITGRGERLIRRGDKTIRQKRSPSARKADTNAFMDGRKRILAFSEAGGTGSSYHADLSRKNQQKRHHYLLQAGWRADTAIQGLGRDHRSNQAQAPKYFLVHTNLKGQKRFISTIARRLSQLGALTKGQRSTGDSGVFSAADNLESTEARDALRRLYRDAVSNRIPDIDLNFLENTLGLTLRDKDGNLKAELPPITQFMNRVLSLPVDKQNSVFDAFQERVDALVEHAIATGTLDQGMETVKADKIEKVSEQTVYKHSTGAEARHVVVNLHRKTKPKTWEQVQNKRVTKYVQSKQTDKVFTVESTNQTEQDERGTISNSVRLVGPVATQYTTEDGMRRSGNWIELEESKAEKLWNEQVSSVPPFAVEQMHMLSGVLLPVWDRLPQGGTQVKRLLTEDGEQILGRVIPADQIKDVLKKLGVSMSAPKITPQQAVDSVMRGGKLVLANDWEIKKVRVEGETLIEVWGPSYTYDDELNRQGVFKRRIQYSTRYFIPTGSEAARVMGNVLKERPIVEIKGDDQAGIQALAEPVLEAGKPAPTRQTRSTEARKDGDEEAGIAAADIVKTWERTFGVPIRVGGFSRRAAGIYKVLPEIVRTKEHHYANLAVAAHEVAHHIDKVTDISERMPKHLRNEVAGLDYEPKGRVFEGFAEFVRHFITETDSQALAPQFHKWFTEEWMPENQRWAKPLLEAQKQARTFADQSVFQRIKTLIGSNRPKEPNSVSRVVAGIENFWNQRQADITNRAHVLEMIDRELSEKGREENVTLEEKWSAYDGTAAQRAAQAFEDGIETIGDGEITKVGPGLAKSLAEFSPEEYDEWKVTALADHTLWASENRPGYSTGMDVEDARNWRHYIDADDAKTKKYDEFTREFADFNNNLIRMRVLTGELEQAEADRIITAYGDNGEFYFPMGRVQERDKSRPFGGGRIVNLPPQFFARSRQGSGRAVRDPIEQALDKATATYKAVMAHDIQVDLAKRLLPEFGGTEGMGGIMDRVDPKRVVTHGRIEEILKELVESGFITEDDARAAKVASRVREGQDDMVSEKDMDAFLERHGLDQGDIGSSAWNEAIDSEPDVLTMISLWRQDFSPNDKKAIVQMRINGQRIMVEQMRMLHDLTAMGDQATAGLVGEVVGEANKLFKTGAVGLSTAFATANVIRDFAAYQVQGAALAEERDPIRRFGMPIVWAARIAGHAVAQKLGMKGAHVHENDIIKMFKHDAGDLVTKLGHTDESKARFRKQKLKLSETDRINLTWQHPIATVKDIAAGLRELIGVSDMLPRLTEYQAVLNNNGFSLRGDGKLYNDATGKPAEVPGWVRIKAIRAAANATIDFKRGGTSTKQLDRTWLPFLNANVQSSVQLARALATQRSLFKPGDEGERARQFLGAMSALAVTGYLAWLLGDDEYEEIDEDTRNRYWIVRLPGVSLRIPKPYEYKWVPNLVESTLNTLYGDDEKIKGTLLKELADKSPDFGGFVRGVFDVTTDWDWFRNRPLTPAHLKRLPKEEQATAYTKQLTKAITPENDTVSPIQMEHLLNASTGNAYNRIVGTAENVLHGDVSTKDIPFIGTLFLNPQQAQSVSDFYRVERQVELDEQRMNIAEQRGKPRESDYPNLDKETLSDYGQLMTAIRKEEKRDLRGRRGHEYEPYIVGLAREALGRDPMEDNPSPLSSEAAKAMPPAIKAIISDFSNKKAKSAILSSGMPDQQKGESDDVYKARLSKWEASRKADEAWLNDHKDSPLVNDAIQGVLRSQGYRDLLHRKGRPAWPSSGKTWIDHTAETRRWMAKVERAESWRQEIQNRPD